MWRIGLVFFVVSLLGLAWPGSAEAQPPGRSCSSGQWSHVECIRRAHFAFDTCQMIGNQAKAHELEPGFFARLIWQESRFDPNALSPARAMGIAQFIASTAALRGLEDPYNPAEALEHSAQYLGEMKRRYGNAGLAAVGYNGGERRAEELIAGLGRVPRETADYVRIITGLSAEAWRDTPPDAPDFRLSKTLPFMPVCLALAKNRRLTPPKAPEPPATVVPLWGVQLAFGTTQTTAERAYFDRTRACRGVTENEKVYYVEVASRRMGRPSYMMARLGRDTREAADALCRRLSAAGCLCRVYRN